MQAHIRNALLSAVFTAVIVIIYFTIASRKRVHAVNQIMLASGALDATTNDINLMYMGDISGERQFLVQLKDHTVKKEVEEALGKKFDEHYIPKNTYIIKGNSQLILSKARSLSDSITFVGHMKPTYKTMLDLSVLEETESTIPRIQLYATVIEDANAVVERLSTIMNDLDAKLVAVSSKKLLIDCPSAKAQTIMSALANQEEVHWIERKLDLKILNHAAGVIMQADGKNYPESSEVGKKPFWEHGIRGEGEIVGIGDTGIDWDMCFFNDPNNAVPFDTISDTHRKIRGYKIMRFKDEKTGAIVGGDRQDTIDGHGTHTAGSIAGSILNTSSTFDALQKYNGIAPDAKIFFTDLSAGDDLNVPDDIYTNYFPDAYKAGAKIHTSSWGCSFQGTFACEYDCNCVWETGKNKGSSVSNEYCRKTFGRPCCAVCNVYNSQAAEVDRFTWENDDFLVLFSAGNVGHVSRANTVGTPATSKNVLSIGASQTFNDAFKDSADHTDFSLVLAYFGMRTEEQCCQYVNSDKLLQAQVRANCCGAYQKAVFEANKKYYNHHNLAYFSSRGPTLNDGRFKPDLVAPGYNVQSMHSDGNTNTKQCGVGKPVLGNDAAIMSQKGTSMSAPLVAGAAALVRQHLRTIFNLKNPSGAIVKGVLIHSAQALSGIVNMDGQGTYEDVPKNYPNSMAGFGLVSLGSALGWDVPFVTQVFDRVDAKKEGRYCYRVENANDASTVPSLRATLSWYDRPAASSATATLVSDLDLDILTWQYGDQTSTRYPGNNNYDYDSVNTVERSEAPARELKYNMTVLVLVRAKALGGDQNYSLIVTLPKSEKFNLVQIDSEMCNDVPVPKLPMDLNKVLTIILSVSAVFTVLFVVITCGTGCFLYKKGYGEPVAESAAASGRRLGTSPSGVVGKITGYWNAIKSWCKDKYQKVINRPPAVTENHVRLDDEDERNPNRAVYYNG